MSLDDLQIEQRENAVVVRFTRPKIRNPLSVRVLDRLAAVIAAISTQRMLIFTGSEGVFASGADLREISAVTAGAAKEFALRGQSLMNKIDRLPQQTIAAINGYCFGGALDLALSCKKRIASPTARFAHPGTGLGIITGWGGTQRLPRLIGQTNAFEIFFTAEPIDAVRALDVGLIDEIAADPLERALEFVDPR
jgi:enoyl-CoA hydratase/carnithine racemase